MKARTYLAFIAPSIFMMVFFIAVPLVIVVLQSFRLTQNVLVTKVIEECTPFGCNDIEVTAPELDAEGKPITHTSWVGLENYRAVLGIEVIKEDRIAEIPLSETLANINFFRALRFTLTFTFITLPFILITGFLVALTINASLQRIRGPLIFVSLLPFIITPIIGALSIRWLFIGDGILTALIEKITGADIAIFAQGWTVELLMLFYRVWHVTPFAFVVFYAGLQTINQDSLESAVVDGASKFQRLRYVIIPHLAPLIIFVSLIHLMDAYRVFEEVIAFSSQAYVISLQWLTYDFLVPDQAGNRSIARAAASAILTMIGIVILLMPLLKKTWEEFRKG